MAATVEALNAPALLSVGKRQHEGWPLRPGCPLQAWTAAAPPHGHGQCGHFEQVSTTSLGAPCNGWLADATATCGACKEPEGCCSNSTSQRTAPLDAHCGRQLGGGACQPQVHAARRRRHDHSVPSGLCSCAVRVCAADLRWVKADHSVARSKSSRQCAGPPGSASNPLNHCATHGGPRPAQPSHIIQMCSLTSLIVPVAASTSTTSGRQCTVAAQSRHTAAQLRLRVGPVDRVQTTSTALKLGPVILSM